MNREEALAVIDEHIEKEHMKKHMIAVGAIMEGLARHLKENDESTNDWMLAGLLHDIDYEKIGDDFSRHGRLSAELLNDADVSKEVLNAIKAHNSDNTNILPETRMDYGLIAADALSGLITSSALVTPDKKLALLEVRSIAKKFKKKDFARNVSRTRILYCEKLDLEKEEFFALGLESLKARAGDLGL